MGERTYLAIDLKSFYASVECMERGLDPMTANLVVADPTRTEKTICLAVSPALKAYGIPGRARLFEVVEAVRKINAGAPRRRAGPCVHREIVQRAGACGKPRAGAGLCRSAAAHGALHALQRRNLQHLSELRCARGYPRLLH